MTNIKRTLYINIAGFVIRLIYQTPASVYLKQILPTLRKHYQGYLLVKKPAKIDYTLHVNEAAPTDFILKKAKQYYYLLLFQELSPVRAATHYLINITQLELIIKTVLYRLLSCHRGMMLHSSASLIKNQAMLFVGPSGAGKSTVSQLLAGQYPVLADDLVAIRQIGKRFYFYQLPFWEKNSKITRTTDPYLIKSVNFLSQSPKTQLKLLNNQRIILSQLLPQVTSSKDDQTKQLELLTKFINSQVFYQFEFSLNKQQVIEAV